MRGQKTIISKVWLESMAGCRHNKMRGQPTLILMMARRLENLT